MEKVTEAAAASAEESAWAGNELRAQSKKLESIVKSLETMVGG